ncbi:MAG: hypothetical protein IT204_19010 [Fimbriimonadaceae bacterium]|nr:hypothetical protein [Fimbriimonadaceae bacterium]
MTEQGTASSEQVRAGLVRALQLNLVGPDADPGYACELLPERPTSWYLTGFLAPIGAPPEDRSDPAAQEELDFGDDAPAADDGGAPERTAARRSLFPASIGLTAFVDGAEESLTATVSWGDYVPEQATPAAEPVAGEAPATPPAAADGPWRRLPHAETLSISLTAGDSDRYGVPGSAGLVVVVELRPVGAAAIGEDRLPPGARSVSAFVVNERQPREQDEPDQSFAFQVELRLAAARGFLGRPNLRGLGGSGVADEWDERVADLQYRDCHEYAVGHGVATRAERTAEGSCRVVATCWLPCAGVERVEAPPVPGVELAMEALAELATGADVVAAMRPLVEQYEAWLGAQAATLDGLSERRSQTAHDLLDDARYAASRMRRGVELLRDNEQVREAFRTANRCMAQAQRRRRAADQGGTPDQVSPPTWRPFQLAFQLMCLPGLVQEQSADRRVVDLLFFPTGGGKTEAYLGLAAFCLVWRRLCHEGPLGGGLSVLMRYTLRLLTLDQLERAAAVICALELERERRPELLGAWPFEIGLWVGAAATPNRLGGSGYRGPGADDTAHRRLGEYRRDSSRYPSPVPLTRCPWCGKTLEKTGLRLVPDERRPTNLAIGCSNYRCEIGRGRALPILVVDEVIYRRLPAFVVATLDKFAALPWAGRVGALFGRVDRHDADGYYGPCDPGRGHPLGGDHLPPPDLIIQDELHLISGPLGTVAGLYEAAIEALASQPAGEGRVSGPKIIASTATVRRAQSQIRALFGRTDTAVFPPPVPNRRDSFFAETKQATAAPARWYVGAAAQGRSMKVVLLRTALTLLGAGQVAWAAAGGKAPNPADPYMTLLGYFSSLRELGGSRHLIEDQVTLQIRQYSHRRRLDPPEHLFADREISPEPLELTSRVGTNAVADAKARLATEFHREGRVDVALATNMISVGLDILRLGLMVVLGQPKACAEYIQATSRVGRDRDRPGLVLALLNLHKPRDRSHFERFVTWHESFYREVEPASVTPFAPRALDRALAAVLVGLCRQGEAALNAPEGAAAMPQVRARVDALLELLVARARDHAPHLAPEEIDALANEVRSRCSGLADAWLRIAQDATSHATPLIYQAYEGNTRLAGKPLLHDVLDPQLPSLPPQERHFRANRSLRDVEPTVELLRSDL